MHPAPSGRAYASPLRRAQAETTRATVLDAAAALFVREGYLRTTMKAIAAEAGTSVETVYAQGSKSALLLTCVDRALGGDDDDVPLTERAAFTDALALTEAAAEQDRRKDLGRLVQAVAERGSLAHGWSTDTATDAVWLLVTSRSAHTALHTLGWSPDLLVTCVTAEIRALLLPSDDRTPA